MKNRRIGKSIINIYCGVFVAGLGWSAQAASTLDLGVLPGDSDSVGYGISRTGRAVGVSSSKAFRTQKNTAITSAPDDNLHNSLAQLIGTIGTSQALDIHQYYTRTDGDCRPGR